MQRHSLLVAFPCVAALLGAPAGGGAGDPEKPIPVYPGSTLAEAEEGEECCTFVAPAPLEKVCRGPIIDQTQYAVDIREWHYKVTTIKTV